MHQQMLNSRLISLLVAITMLTLAFGPAADAAVANWLAPMPGQEVIGRNVEVSVGFNTQSELNVTRVELWVNGSFYSQKYFVNPESRGVVSLWWDSAKYPKGSHDLVVKIYAGDRLLTSVSGRGTVGTGGAYDTKAPAVTFANIKSGDVLKGKTNIKIKAADNGGEAPLVTLLVDKSLKLLKNTPPYAYDLDTTTYDDGNHELETFAYDNAGNKSDPAVVKVEFKNGMKQPVVASLSIKPSSTPAPSEDDGVTKSQPIVTAVPVVPSVEKGTAARSADSSPAKISAGASSVPVTATVKPAVKTVASVPIAAKVISPAASAKPSSVAVNVKSADTRVSNAKPANKTGSVQAIAPVTLDEARVASIHSIDVPADSPRAKTSALKAQLLTGAAVEPAIKGDAKSSETKQMALAPPASLRTQNTQELKTLGISIAPDAISEPIISSAKDQTIANNINKKQVVHSARVVLGKSITPDVVPTMDAASAASPRPVRMAMLPNLEKSRSKSSTSNSTPCPPSIKKDMKARIEKTTALAVGQIKLRDFINKLGGVVVWDAVSRTIVVNTNTMILEIKIGSNVVKVNGNDMVLDSAPYVVDGRTVLDTHTYNQICAQLQNFGLIASAKIN